LDLHAITADNDMREADRSQLKRLLIVWAVAWLASILGYCAASAVFIYGLLHLVKSFGSNDSVLVSLGPMTLGLGLLLVLTVLIIAVVARFEDRCWELVRADSGTWVGDGAGDRVLSEQADGRAERPASVRVGRSRRLSKRLAVLVEHAWPRRRS
jgi:hypothetical protein